MSFPSVKVGVLAHLFELTILISLQVFEITDFNKKHKSISMKPFNFAVILKLSKAQLQEKAFKVHYPQLRIYSKPMSSYASLFTLLIANACLQDGVIDQVYELLMEQFHIHAHCIGFPELVVPAVIQVRINKDLYLA